MAAFDTADFGKASMVGQVGGALSSIIGSFFAASAQKSALKFQAKMADTNARIAELGAQSTLMQGQSEVGRLTMRAGAIKSSQRASMAANGIDLGVGNAAELQASTDLMKEIDSNQITANAVRNAWGYKLSAVNSSNDALIKSATANSISPLSAAGSSLLGGASRVAQSWYAMNKSGALDNSPSTGVIGGGGGGGVLGYSSGDLGAGIRISF